MDFATFLFLTPITDSVSQLIIIFFITAFGLGALMPNAMSLALEYSLLRIRVTMMTIVSCGFTMVAVFGGSMMSANWSNSFIFLILGATSMITFFSLIIIPEVSVKKI